MFVILVYKHQSQQSVKHPVLMPLLVCPNILNTTPLLLGNLNYVVKSPRVCFYLLCLFKKCLCILRIVKSYGICISLTYSLNMALYTSI